MNKTILILDLDGVLITNPPWKADELDSDGYSKFNPECVNRLNELLGKYNMEIWLSSSRRKGKTLEEFNTIFKIREISQPITDFLPDFPDLKTRKEEVLAFIRDEEVSSFLILDDDKSLNGLTNAVKERLILTQLHKGLDEEALKTALEIISSS